ncbi:PqiC family protein [Rubellimicrobium aerolatum]|uniref:Membrane integrity-associated transporter subunit PqiC n=1 Tax=Rubellimicrobium aerolatum TaxID=490979 RepID=A0ABW0SEY1_9RHOB|nr:ABC-type transport auxiliary lipoprotein family protein [Rubellimicrobium aerolatum]MBP1805610.1 putative lipoprotein YmbA [Rubellimicrobium aerolatum]
MIHRPASLVLVLLLAACSREPLRLAVPPAPASERVGVAFASVEVLDVSLPAYAQDDRIYVQGQGGALTAVPRAVLADDPARALTLDLSRTLGALTGARSAPEPWPFEERAQAQVDVRVAEIVADATAGAFVIRGQYFVASQDGTGRDRAREFRVAVPLPPDPGPAAIASARGQATLQLARQIATDGLR